MMFLTRCPPVSLQMLSMAPPGGTIERVLVIGIDWDTLRIQAAAFLSELSDAPGLPARANVRRSAILAPSIGMAAEDIDKHVGSLGNSVLRTTAIDPVSTWWALPDELSPQPRVVS